MPTRRQEKVAHIVRQVVSETIQHHLSDPRIEGLVSVTSVEMAPDLRAAEVYLSILGTSRSAENTTFLAIEHAQRRIQGRVAEAVRSKFCPVIRLHKDDKFKQALQTLNLIDRTVDEYSTPAEPTEDQPRED